MQSTSTSRIISNEKVFNEIIDEIWSNPLSLAFRYPVNYKKLQLYDYPKIIKNPMDLSSMKKKIKLKEYLKISDFCNDLNLIWENCKRYNIEGSAIYVAAKELAELSDYLLESQLGFVNQDPQNKIIEKSSNKEDIQISELLQDNEEINEGSLLISKDTEEKEERKAIKRKTFGRNPELSLFDKKLLLNKVVKKLSETQIKQMLKMIKLNDLEAFEIISENKIRVYLDKICEATINSLLRLFEYVINY